MLQQVLEHIHNMFIKTATPGTFTIADGTISALSLLEGQRFWIVGSVLNDGVYTYHSSGIKDDDDSVEVGLQDETFAGTICALAVPPAVLALSEEISAWVEEYGDAMNSPYQSESVIGVYSYTKKQSNAGDNDADDMDTWQHMFRSRLNRWRKVAL